MTSPVARPSGLEIAVIGMSCHVPGASSVEQFWENLREGRESISFFSDEELVSAGVPEALLRHPDYVRAAGVLDEVGRFDAELFGYTPREAQLIDPQQRLFLERAQEALERAGYEPARYRGAIGVFGGVSASSYLLALLSHPDLWELAAAHQTVLDKDFLASRVAYKLGLEGPAVVVQTACSSSLAAVHVACQSLLGGECDIALAGGVSVALPQATGYVYEVDGIRSRDGHCRAFDASATGAVRGNGVGLVVLKRLAEALADGDRVEAVIKGSAMNNDGARKVGFTAPRVEGQARVIRSALALAGVAPDTVGFVEAHGTGTALGDPIEVAALTQAFRAGTERRGFCALGSVKTNVGHLDAAAGVIGLIKAVLMLRHRELVPSLHFEHPNPRLQLETSPFYVSAERAPWPEDGHPRRAGVSSFGMGGTNVHVVLEEPPARASAPPAEGPHVLVLSARTETALAAATARLAAHLERHPELDPGDVAFTLREGRRTFPHRRAVVVRGIPDAARRLAAQDEPGVVTGHADERPRPVALLFTGQGAQHVGMARGLYDRYPRFRGEVDACAAVLEPLLGLDLRRLLFAPGAEPEAASRLDRTRFTQPALFVIEYALARLWSEWGIEPEALIGHSVGEYVAACLSGVMDRDHALLLVAERGRLMQKCQPGAMLAVALSAGEARARLDGALALAAHNGPEACVIAGPFADVERCEAALRREGIPFARLATSHAFHSPAMDRVLEPFARLASGVTLRPPRIPFVSNLTGTWITQEEATSPTYWGRHLRETVRFAEGLEALLAEPRRVLLEVGPGQTLTSLARRRLGPGAGPIALASLPHPRQQPDDVVFLLTTAARLWTAGVLVDWSAGEPPRRRVLLPTYPFEGERYLVEPRRGASRAAPAAAKAPFERWFYVPSWKRAPWPAAKEAGSSRVCVFADGLGLGEALAGRLRAAGSRVAVVRAGAGFAREGPGRYVAGPGRREDFARLLAALQEDGLAPDRLVHLWGLDGEDEQALERGFHSLVALGQALGEATGSGSGLVAVTSGACDVTGEEPLDPLRSTVLGACRVIPQEYPQLGCRMVDLVAPTTDVETQAARLEAEVFAPAREPVAAHRGAYRWVQCFDPVEAAPVERLRPQGVYLVTGGLGEVGLDVARHLARSVRARLVLTSRRGLPERAAWDAWLAGHPGEDGISRAILAVKELEAEGAEVMVAAADVADRAQMGEALARARERFGGLHGVVHAAGIREAAQMLAGADREHATRQFRPKIAGTRVLGELLDAERLDFVLMTSSLASVLGGLGFAAYAAANQFVDAFAHAQHRRGRTGWMSVDLDGWRSRPGPGPAGAALEGEEGPRAVVRALGLGLPQVLVSTTDLARRQAEWGRPGEERTADAGPGHDERHERPALQAVYVAPEDPVERRLAEVWGRLLGIDPVGVHDNFFELGGSSLLAVQLIARLRAEFPGPLSVATLFGAPTVRALAAAIREEDGGAALARSRDRGQSRAGNRARAREGVDAAAE